MARKKMYTYTDWWNGKVCLNTCERIYFGKEPIVVYWKNFKEEDVLKIKRKQKLL